MRWLVLLLELVGFGMVVAGVALWSVPAAFIVAGVAMLAVGLLVEQPWADEPDTE